MDFFNKFFDTLQAFAEQYSRETSKRDKDKLVYDFIVGNFISVNTSYTIGHAELSRYVVGKNALIQHYRKSALAKLGINLQERVLEESEEDDKENGFKHFRMRLLCLRMK